MAGACVKTCAPALCFFSEGVACPVERHPPKLELLLAKQKRSVQSREREMKKRDRENRKRAKAEARRERRETGGGGESVIDHPDSDSIGPNTDK